MMQQHAGTNGAEVGLDEQRMRVGIRIVDFLFHRCAREREKVGGQATLRGPHLLLQTRTKVHNEDLDDVFRRWYPYNRKATPIKWSYKDASNRIKLALELSDTAH